MTTRNRPFEGAGHQFNEKQLDLALEEVRRHGTRTASQVADSLGYTPARALGLLRQLVRQGRVRELGEKKAGRLVFEFAPASAPESTADVLPWQPGDVVLDARDFLYRRYEPYDSDPEWVWGTVHETVQAQPDPHLIHEDVPARPLTLLIRSGKPVGGIAVNEPTVAGKSARETAEETA